MFDTLQHTQYLKASGVPAQEAEVHAQYLGKAIVHFTKTLVTKDYLDTVLEARFTKQDAQFADIRAQLRLHNWFFALLAVAITLRAIGDT